MVGRMDAGLQLWALSVWEPWTWAIVELPEGRAKRIENRAWPPYPWIRRRRWIALHSAQRFDDEEARILVGQRGGTLPPSYQSAAMRERQGKIHALVRIDGSVDPYGLHQIAPDDVEQHALWWAESQYAWRIGAVHKLADPVEVRGAQKVWRVPVPAAARALAQVPAEIVAALARPGT